MAEVLLFHHAQGQTPGFHAFAEELRRAGHGYEPVFGDDHTPARRRRNHEVSLRPMDVPAVVPHCWRS